jgi:hypothetical protein
MSDFEIEWQNRRPEIFGLIWRTALLFGLLYWCWGKTGLLFEQCQPWDPSCRAMGYFDRVDSVIGWAALIFIAVKLHLILRHLLALASLAFQETHRSG